MQIGAKASDWHPDSPRIKRSLWFVPVSAVIVIFALIALAGRLLNGNGAPFLS